MKFCTLGALPPSVPQRGSPWKLAPPSTHSIPSCMSGGGAPLALCAAVMCRSLRVWPSSGEDLIYSCPLFGAPHHQTIFSLHPCRIQHSRNGRKCIQYFKHLFTDYCFTIEHFLEKNVFQTFSQ